jgi:hypothetical protein
VFCAGTSNAPEAALVSAVVVCPWWASFSYYRSKKITPQYRTYEINAKNRY